MPDKISHIRDWKPARKFPETYPGDCPPGSYLLLGDKVYPLIVDESPGLQLEKNPGESTAVDEILDEFRLPLLHDRFALLAYGANRNPATLHIKFLNYNYKCKGDTLAVPMLRGQIIDGDVVACGLSGQGYFYGDLLINSEFTHSTYTEVWIALLDHDQLRVMHDSEGIREGDLYKVAQFEGIQVAGIEKTISPLGYAGQTPILLSPEYQSPLGFRSIRATMRQIPEMTAIEMLAHLLDAFDLRRQIVKCTGLKNDVHLAAELAKFLNGQWWYHFNTGQPPIRGYREIMRLFKEQITLHSLQISMSDQLQKRGQILSTEEAYHPDPCFRWPVFIKNQ
ncbi:MAG: hypothetical protein ACE5HI_02050 [bacterium]